jgi:plastocyanin
MKWLRFRYRAFEPGRRRFLQVAGVTAAGLAVAPAISACNGGARHVVEMTSQLSYKPSSITIKKGEWVTWINNSPYTHTVTCDPSRADNAPQSVLPSGAQPFDSGDIYNGRTFAHKFDVSGRYVYFCLHHQDQGMVGDVLVQDS